MINIVENVKTIKGSNLLFLVETKEDLEKLDFLELEKPVLDKSMSFLKQKENKFLQIFLWWKKFEVLNIAFYLDKEKRTLIEFLWENTKNLQDNYTILSNKKENLLEIVKICILSRYKFQRYKTEKKEDQVNIVCEKDLKLDLQDEIETIDNVILARDLWETPAVDLTPEAFVNFTKSLKLKKIKIKVLTPRDIQKQWLWLLWAVWKWSVNKPYMVILERIVNRKFPTIWIVWKWIIFDSGWINLKSEKWLYSMKDDMSWAWNLLCTMKNLDRKNLNVNIVACIPLAENFISWESYRPSDILKAYNRKTVDVINTDAEWRLILADGVSYISKNYKLDKVITMATLTWACLYAIWYRYAWIMWTDREIIERLLDYSKNNFEKYVELPFDNYFIEKTKWKIADYDNLTEWIYAWASMWGAFIYNFLENKEKYTHIDIAWVADNSYEPYGLCPKSATWFWVISLTDLFINLK